MVELDALVKENPTLLVAAVEATGATAAAIANGAPEDGAYIAGQGARYNYLTHKQIEEYGEALEGCEAQGNCEEVIQMFRDLSLQQQREFYEYCEGNPSGCQERYGYLTEEYDDFLEANLELSQADYRPLVPALNDKHVFDMQYEEVKDYLVLTGRAQDLGLDTEEAGQYVDQQGVVLTGLSAISGGGLIGRSATNRVVTQHADGTFSVSDWAGYPGGVPRPPEGTTYRLLSGTEYAEARRLADNANAQLRRQGVVPQGHEIHEIVPVKYGGSPTDPANKVYLPAGTHRKEVTPWWNRLQRDLTR